MDIDVDLKQRELANRLIKAENTLVGIEPLTSSYPDLRIEDAYHIQLFNVSEKVNQGNKIVGKKVGLTSKAMQQLLGVNEPDYGHLLSNMIIEDGGMVPKKKVLQPKVEGEVAFILKEDLQGPHITIPDVIKATNYILPAIEVVDSRVQNWKIKLVDTIADNASSAFYVLGGKPIQLEDIKIELTGMVLKKNGEVVNTGTGAAALGNPVYCIAWLANRLSDFGITLKAGEVILSGALSAAVDAEEGDLFTVQFAHLGQVSVRF